MTNIAEILRLLNNLIRLGTIAEVDPVAVRVRVQTGDNETDWLPWITARAGTTRDWDPPTVGEQVVLFSPAGDLAQALVLAGINTEQHPAPAALLNLYRRVLPDGTTLTYDHEAKKLDVYLAGDATINVTGNATVNVSKTAAVTAGTEATVDAPKIKLNGGAGVVTGAHICQMTGKPHSDCSTTVFAGK